MDQFDDIVDTLFYADKEQMERITCPLCGGAIFYEVADENDSMRVQCSGCGSRVSMGKLAEIPNCIAFYGARHTFQAG